MVVVLLNLIVFNGLLVFEFVCIVVMNKINGFLMIVYEWFNLDKDKIWFVFLIL